jgi:hypothetical protein
MRALYAFAVTTIVVLGSSAVAQKTAVTPSAPSQRSLQPGSPFRGKSMPLPHCTTMRQRVSSAMDAASSAFNATAARQEAAKGDQACATGDAQTAQGYYQKALDLVSSGGK